MKYKRKLLIFLFVFIFLISTGCSKAKEKEMSYKEEKVELSNIKTKEYNKLKELTEKSGVKIVNAKEDEVSILSFSDKGTSNFSNYNLKNNDLEILSTISIPQYIDYIGKYENKFIMLYSDDKDLYFYTVDNEKNEFKDKISEIKSVAAYDMDNYIAIHYNEIIDNKLVDRLELLSKKDFKIKEVKKTEASFKEDSQKLSGDIIGGVTTLGDSLFYQVYSVEGEMLSSIDNIKNISSFEFSDDNSKEIDFKERVNAFFGKGDFLVYNLYLKDKPSEQGSYLRYSGVDNPIPLGDSANYFLDIKEKENLIFINSPRAIYSIDKNSLNLKYVEKPKESSQFILSDSKDYDFLNLNRDNNLVLYKFN